MPAEQRLPRLVVTPLPPVAAPRETPKTSEVPAYVDETTTQTTPEPEGEHDEQSSRVFYNDSPNKKSFSCSGPIVCFPTLFESIFNTTQKGI